MKSPGKISNLKESTKIRNFSLCSFNNKLNNKSNYLRIALIWKGKNSCNKLKKNLETHSMADNRVRTSFSNLEI